MLERGRLEVGVLHRLANELAAGVDKPIEPPGIGFLRGGLRLEPAADVVVEQPLRGHLPQLLVAGQERHLSVTDLACLLAELLKPGIEHERMFGPIDHIHDDRRRIRPAPTGLVIFREGPQHDRLRSDPERVRTEGGDRLERL